MGRRINRIFILMVMLLSPWISFASDAVLDRVRGQVLLKSPVTGKYYQIKRRAALSFGDQLKTGKGALAHVRFKDGAAILVKENAVFMLEGDLNQRRVSFTVGEFLIGLKKKLARGKTFEVKTPTAVAAVRGTMFWGLSDAQNNTTYACFTGSISIQAQDKTVILQPGQKIFIPFDKPMEDAKFADIPVSYVDTFAVDNSLQGLDQILKKKE